MTTYCLLVFWLVKRFNWNSTHCFKVHSAVFLKFQSVTRPFQELELYLEHQTRVTLWNVKKTETWALKQFQNIEHNTRTRGKLRFIPIYIYIYEGVQTSRKYGNLTSTIPENNTITMALKGSKNTEHLTSRSPENNITAALTGSNNTENLTSTSLENNLKAALKCSRKKPTVDDYDFTHLYFEEIFAKLLCRKKLPFATPMCSPLVSCVFVVFPQPHCSWGLLLAWRFTFQDCLAKTRTRCGPARWHFPINLDQNAILNGMNNGTPYANPELDLNIQWKTLARQKADIGLHPHPIVWRRSTTKGSERLRQKNVGVKSQSR